MKKLATIVFTILCVLPYAAHADLGAAPHFEVTDETGTVRKLSDFEGKVVVLEWTNYGCPFVQKHYKSGNMQGLQNDYTEEDIVWLSVISSAAGKQGHLSIEEAPDAMEAQGVRATHVLLDESGDMGRAYGAKTTPHMFIINPEGHIIYRGAIDDTPSTDIGDVEGAENYVMSALEAYKRDEEISTPTSTPYGCSIKY